MPTELKQGEPLAVSCPVCLAGKNWSCTQPEGNGRRAVGWFHSARVDKAQAVANGWEP